MNTYIVLWIESPKNNKREGSQKSEVWNCMYKYKTVEIGKKMEYDPPRPTTQRKPNDSLRHDDELKHSLLYIFSAAIVADLLNAVYTEDWIYFISPQFIKLKMVKENFKLNNKILNPISIPIKMDKNNFFFF